MLVLCKPENFKKPNGNAYLFCSRRRFCLGSWKTVTLSTPNTTLCKTPIIYGELECLSLLPDGAWAPMLGRPGFGQGTLVLCWGAPDSDKGPLSYAGAPRTRTRDAMHQIELQSFANNVLFTKSFVFPTQDTTFSCFWARMTGLSKININFTSCFYILWELMNLNLRFPYV